MPTTSLTLSPTTSTTCYSTISHIDTTYAQALAQHLHLLLTSKYTQSNNKAFNRYIKNYLYIIIDDLYKAYTSQVHYFNSTLHYIDSTAKRTSWGRLTIDGKKHWGIEVILPLLLLKVYQGHTGAASGYEFKDQFLLNAIEEHSLYYKPAPVVVNSSNYVNTKCNRMMLSLFANDSTNHITSRRKAKQIIASLDKDDYFKQEIKMPIIDRTYLLGLNLQMCKTELRAAALADQWAYDLNCAVFALFASVAHELSNTAFPVIQAYLQDRVLVRTDISNQTGLTYKQVKTALTSVGFGKRARKANDLQVIMTTDIGKALVEEFRNATRIVYKHYKDNTKRSKRLYHLFAIWESEYMREFQLQSNQVANLTIHDCAVMLKPVNLKQVLPMITLGFTTHTEYFNLTETQL